MRRSFLLAATSTSRSAPIGWFSSRSSFPASRLLVCGLGFWCVPKFPVANRRRGGNLRNRKRLIVESAEARKQTTAENPLPEVPESAALEPTVAAVCAIFLAEFVFEHSRFFSRANYLHRHQHEQDRQPRRLAERQHQPRQPERAEDIDRIANPGINSARDKLLSLGRDRKGAADLYPRGSPQSEGCYRDN